jgi:hypothetical protein
MQMTNTKEDYNQQTAHTKNRKHVPAIVFSYHPGVATIKVVYSIIRKLCHM